MSTLAEAFGLRIAFFVTAITDLALIGGLVWWDAVVQGFLFRSAPQEMQGWFVHDMKFVIDVFAVMTMIVIALTDFFEMCRRSADHWRKKGKEDNNRGGSEE